MPESQTQTGKPSTAASSSDIIVVVFSMLMAPCGSVGGKRFSFLSRYLSPRFQEYHVIARREREPYADTTAFKGSVHRVRSWVDYPFDAQKGPVYWFMRAWDRWLCIIDPYIGWVPPAIIQALRITQRRHSSIVIVSVPYFSQVLAALVISILRQAKLIIDYRDPMTAMPRPWPKPFGRSVSRLLERAAIKRASAIVFCSDIMRDEFLGEFGEIAPPVLSVIYNGFLGFEADSVPSGDTGRTAMLYAGEFYGARRLALIAPTLRQMLDAGEITPSNFRFHVYSKLRAEDHRLIESLGLSDVIEEHEPVPYHEIKRIMAAADILFLPSGDDVPYAVPFKFFDYLSVRKPILAVAPERSAVAQLMSEVDCGQFARLEDPGSIRSALAAILRGERNYSFAGASVFLWERAAHQYHQVISTVAFGSALRPAGRE